jgi:hypothetical protein
VRWEGGLKPSGSTSPPHPPPQIHESGLPLATIFLQPLHFSSPYPFSGHHLSPALNALYHLGRDFLGIRQQGFFPRVVSRLISIAALPQVRFNLSSPTAHPCSPPCSAPSLIGQPCVLGVRSVNIDSAGVQLPCFDQPFAFATGRAFGFPQVILVPDQCLSPVSPLIPLHEVGTLIASTLRH